jgi:hypothetical protein
MKVIFYLCSFLLLALPTFAQENKPPTLDILQLMERLFPIQDEDLDYEALYELLLELYQNPLEINRVTADELQATYLLSTQQIQSLLEHRRTWGDFLSLYELQTLPNWDSTTLVTILPFLTLETTATSSKTFFERLRSEENNFLVIRHRRTWEFRKGYSKNDSTLNPTSRYMGDPNDLFLRYRIQHAKDFSLGLILEKDAGEVLTWDTKTSRYGFNFASFHFTRYGMGKWKTISLGDFQASFGQGLVFGAGFSLGKGAETVPTVRRSSLGLLPYTASIETGFFRGIGLTRQLGRWQSSLLISSVGKDGRVTESSDSLGAAPQTLTSLSQTGLHRSLSELSTKNQVREINLGSNLQYSAQSGRWSAGLNFLHTQFSIPWIRNATSYNAFDFSGQTNQVGSLYANLTWKNFALFGESARSRSQGQGTVLGLVSSLSRTVDFSLLWRSYDRHFHSLYATAFAESTRPSNERGVYLGFQVKPSATLKFNAYVDFFTFPWLKFRVSTPSQGQEWLVRWSYQPQKTRQVTLQFKQERKMRNITEEVESTPTQQVGMILKSQAQASLELDISPELSSRSRILWNQVTFDQKKTQGWMLIQECSFSRRNWKLTARMALFDTDTFDNRIYAYEQNAVGTFAIPAFSGRGSRQYILAQYRIHSRFTAYFRIARTIYSDREVISSGMQAISGPKQTDTLLLLRYDLH